MNSTRSGAFRVAAAVALILVAVTVGAVQGRADDREDHERARDAVRSGQIVRLSEILEKVEQDFIGRMLEVELEEDDGRWVYEIKLLTEDGRIVKLRYDARDKTLIGAHGQGLSDALRKHK